MADGSGRQEFGQRLDALLDETGLEAQQVAARVMTRRPPGASWRVTRNTLSAWRNAANLPSARNEDGFWTVVRVATGLARGRAARGQPVGELLDEAAWGRLLQRARATPPLPGARSPGEETEPGPAAGALRVREWDPRRLGVHAAISVPGLSGETLPEYVPRDADGGESGVRAQIAAAAARRGGFLLLVGGSSVGKTRCAAEAVRALLPGWWLVYPLGPAEVAALAAGPARQMVVWLDELQRYLDGQDGLTGGVMRALLNADHPVLAVGTLWPDRYAAYTAVPGPGSPDPHAREREVLDLAAVVRIGPAFSPAEQARARSAAARDRRLAVALETAGYGLTQTLAAAPQLVARWQDAESASPYARAMLTAALDLARLGARAPLSAGC